VNELPPLLQELCDAAYRLGWIESRQMKPPLPCATNTEVAAAHERFTRTRDRVVARYARYVTGSLSSSLGNEGEMEMRNRP
jgi:hypothetical protein